MKVKIPKIMFIVMFLLMLIPLASAWNDFQGQGLGFNGVYFSGATNGWNLTNEALSYESNAISYSAPGDTYLSFQPVRYTQDSVYYVAAYDNSINTLTLYDDNLQVKYQYYAGNNYQIAYQPGAWNWAGSGDINAIFAVLTNSTSAIFAAFGLNGTTLQMLDSYEMAAGFSANDFISGNVMCDLSNPVCYIYNANFTLLSFNVANFQSISLQDSLLMSNASVAQCHNTETHLLIQPFDTDFDGFKEILVPVKYNCLYNQWDLTQADADSSGNLYSNPMASYNLKAFVIDDTFAGAPTLYTYPRFLISNYDNAGLSEIYVTGFNSTKGAYLYKCNNALNCNAKTHIYEGLRHNGAGNYYSSFSQPISVYVNADSNLDICFADSSHPYTSIPVMGLKCVSGDLTATYATINMSNIPAYGYAKSLAGFNIQAALLDNNLDYEILMGEYIIKNINEVSTYADGNSTMIHVSSAIWGNLRGGYNIDSYTGNVELFANDGTKLYKFYQTTGINYANVKLVLWGYVYDTGSPICFNTTRTYFSPAWNETGGATTARIRAWCDATNTYSAWSAYDVTLGAQSVDCNSGNTLGTFSDSVCVEDSNGNTGNCVNLTYDVRQSACYTKGLDSGYTYVNNTAQNDISEVSSIPGTGGAESALGDLFTGMGFNTTGSRLMLALIIIIMVVLMTAKFGVWAMIISGLLTFIGLIYLGLIPIWVLVVMILIMGVLVFFKFYNGGSGGGA